MLRRGIGLGIFYGALMVLYTTYSDLKCRYVLKSAECEVYRALCDAYADVLSEGKQSKKKEK